MRKYKYFLATCIIVISVYSCKKDSTQSSVTNPPIVGKWTHTKNIDWYTNILTGNTIKDTTVQTHDVYLDFQSNGTLYEKVWNETTSAYIYDTSMYSINGSILTISGSDLTLTDPYNADILTLTSNNLNIHTVDTVGNYRDENWDYLIK